MKYLSKTRALFSEKLSNLERGLVTFLVEPEDLPVFRIKLRDLLKRSKRKSKQLPLLLSVSLFKSPRTLAQNSFYRLILEKIATDSGSDAYGSDPENIHEGVLARAALQFGYPTIEVAGVRVPERSHKTMTDEMNLLIEVARVIAGEYKADLSDIHLGE